MRNRVCATWVCLMLLLAGVNGQQPSTATASLDFEFFKARVQPIFLTKRPGGLRAQAQRHRPAAVGDA